MTDEALYNKKIHCGPSMFLITPRMISETKFTLKLCTIFTTFHFICMMEDFLTSANFTKQQKHLALQVNYKTGKTIIIKIVFLFFSSFNHRTNLRKYEILTWLTAVQTTYRVCGDLLLTTSLNKHFLRETQTILSLDLVYFKNHK